MVTHMKQDKAKPGLWKIVTGDNFAIVCFATFVSLVVLFVGTYFGFVPNNNPAMKPGPGAVAFIRKCMLVASVPTLALLVWRVRCIKNIFDYGFAVRANVTMCRAGPERGRVYFTYSVDEQSYSTSVSFDLKRSFLSTYSVGSKFKVMVDSQKHGRAIICRLFE